MTDFPLFNTTLTIEVAEGSDNELTVTGGSAVNELTVTGEQLTIPALNLGTAGSSAYDIWLAQGNTGSVAEFLLSLKGADGTIILAAVAAGALSGHRVVKSNGNGTLSYASAATLADAGEIVGVTVGAASDGAAVSYQAIGPITEPSWTWAAGPIFCGLDGALTQTAPTSGFIRQIGVALTATMMLLDLQPAIVLGA